MAQDDKDIIEASLKAKTNLGKEFYRQWRGALQTRKTTRVGDYTLDALLKECFDARDDKTSCAEQELRELYPEWAAMPISIVAWKVNILVSLIRESLVDVADAPFIIDPTPVPQIPAHEKSRIVGEFTTDVIKLTKQFMGIPDTVTDADLEAMTIQALSADQRTELANAINDEMARRKTQGMIKVREHAKEQALNLQRDIYDKTIEGGYREAIIEFADDFANYPFGCMHGPFPVMSNETVWEGDTFKEKPVMAWKYERVSPFDLFWTEDSPDTQSGTAVFIRKSVPYNFLYDAREMAREHKDSGYQESALTELIKTSQEGTIPRRWTEYNLSNPETESSIMPWQQGDSFEILIRYGRFTGHDLKEMGFVGLNPDKSYETKVVMAGGQIIQCQINKNPSKYKRPVFTASFERRNGSIAGVGLAQKLLRIHKAFRALINLTMYNIGLSAEPISEIDMDRVLEYIPDGWEDNPVISPGQVFPTTNNRISTNRAVQFTEIPNITASALNMANFILELSHTFSNIPAALHGQPVGSGANRTVRGLLTLQGNTLKPIHSALVNLDIGVIEPMVKLLYMLLVMHDDAFEYTGDAKIIAKGAASMIQREIEKQTAMESIQILGQLGEGVNPEILNRAVTKLLMLSNILEPGETAMRPTPTPVQQTAQPVTPQAQGIPGQEPVDTTSGLPQPVPQQ